MKFYVVYFYHKNNSFGINSKFCDTSYNVFTAQGLDTLAHVILETEKADNVFIVNIISFHDEKEK